MFALHAIVTRSLPAELRRRRSRHRLLFVRPHELECFVERPAPGFEGLPEQCDPAQFLYSVSLDPKAAGLPQTEY